jgi:hypothetical protein
MVGQTRRSAQPAGRQPDAPVAAAVARGAADQIAGVAVVHVDLLAADRDAALLGGAADSRRAPAGENDRVLRPKPMACAVDGRKRRGGALAEPSRRRALSTGPRSSARCRDWRKPVGAVPVNAVENFIVQTVPVSAGADRCAKSAQGSCSRCRCRRPRRRVVRDVVVPVAAVATGNQISRLAGSTAQSMRLPAA